MCKREDAGGGIARPSARRFLVSKFQALPQCSRLSSPFLSSLAPALPQFCRCLQNPPRLQWEKGARRLLCIRGEAFAGCRPRKPPSSRRPASRQRGGRGRSRAEPRGEKKSRSGDAPKSGSCSISEKGLAVAPLRMNSVRECCEEMAPFAAD